MHTHTATHTCTLQVHYVYHGHCPELESLLGCAGPFWGRQYFFWHDGRPLTLIYEVFSPRLQQYLGPMHAHSHLGVGAAVN